MDESLGQILGERLDIFTGAPPFRILPSPWQEQHPFKGKRLSDCNGRQRESYLMSYIQATRCGKACSMALSSGYLLRFGGLPVGLIEKYSRRHSDDGTGQNMWKTFHKNVPTTNHFCSLKPDTSKGISRRLCRQALVRKHVPCNLCSVSCKHQFFCARPAYFTFEAS